MATYSIADLSHREDVRDTGRSERGLDQFCDCANRRASHARADIRSLLSAEGFDQNADLTRVPGRPGRAEGQVLDVMGRVFNLKGGPVRNAKVEIWQANAHGRYTHPSDTNPAPLDPNFEGSVVLTTDQEGRYRFKTINPAGYPAGPNRMRPAHIHFQISGRQDRLVTQMYFEGDPYNDTDRFLLTALEQKEMLIAKLLPATSEMEPEAKLVVFDIVLSTG